MAETDNKIINGQGLSHLASNIKSYVSDQAEVYVGSEPPVSGNYKLWVDTDEPASTYVKSGDNITVLTNNAGYITSSYHDSTKQDVLTAGANISITNNTISATDTTYNPATTSANGLMSSTDKAKLDGISTQAKYVSVASTGTSTDEVNYITIDNTEYKLAGSGSGEPAAYLKDASVSGNTLTLTKKDDSTVTFTPEGQTYTAGQNIQISAQNVISATDTTYSAGTGIAITNGVISNTGLTTVPNATNTVVGGVTVRLSGNTLYIRNDGQEA